LLAGLPWFGADIGGAVTLFVAGGLWFGTRRANGRLRPSVVGFGAAFAAAGLVLVLLAHRFLSLSPTHATRFVGQIESGPSHLFGTLARRLAVGAHQFLSVPAAVVPIAGLIVFLVIVARRPEPLRAPLRDRVWRNVIGVLSASALVAYLANDTGVTAASPAFLYGMAALVVPTLAVFEGAPVPKRRPAPGRKARPEKPKGSTAPAAAVGAASAGPDPSAGAGAMTGTGGVQTRRRRRKRGRRR
jgi:hypothetical protein